MKSVIFFFGLTILIMFTPTHAQETNTLAIPYTKYVLQNGLTLVVHEDKKAPIVAVNVWYHVGSKDEKSGRTGFAHLFEHLMFNGSENYNEDWCSLTSVWILLCSLTSVWILLCSLTSVWM